MAVRLKGKRKNHVAKLYSDKMKGVPRALDQAVQVAKTEIEIRANQGRDVRGRFFKGYAKSTKRQKKNKGRGRGAQTHPVNLTNTGHMLRSIATEVRIKGEQIIATIGFRGGKVSGQNATAGQKAKFHNDGTRHMPARKFFGLAQVQIDRIRKKLIDAIRKG